jgi:uncharacterized membrane protein/mono/diheme cytochrome c family protein
MTIRILGICVIAMIAAMGATVALAQTPATSAATATAAAATIPAEGGGKASLPADVGSILQIKCSQCHGAGLAKPAAGLGYVTDARKLVAEGKVVPGKPDDSPLFRLVNSKAMPPATAKAGGLSPEQIETIRQWIAAGAEAWAVPAMAATGPAAGRTPASMPATAPAAPGMVERIGRLHLQLVHFPIALLLAALLAEILHRISPAGNWRRCARYCLWLGALGAVAAATTGWLLDSSREWGAATEEYLEPHQWLGTATAILAVGMVIFCAVLARPEGKGAAWIVLAGTLALGGLVSLAGHYGGLVAWGPEFLPW